jgi:D-alanine transaminase
MSTVYLNGEFLPEEEARISANDRGFLLADGLYEVTPVYRGKLFLADRHIARLDRGLSELRIDFDTAAVEGIKRTLVQENRLEGAETALVYLQVTRGVAPRTHAFPKDPVPPTVYAFARAWQRPSRERWEQGFRAITVPDDRWMRVDIKTIQLLPNALAMQAAAEADAQNVVFVRDGVVTEGGHANLFAVLDGVLRTHPADNLILHGITRGFVLELARAAQIPVQERAFTAEELVRAGEVFYTGTTTEVYPVVDIDGRAVGDGSVGPVTRGLHAAFMDVLAGL